MMQDARNSIEISSAQDIPIEIEITGSDDSFLRQLSS
jgi:hypothetical protein